MGAASLLQRAAARGAEVYEVHVADGGQSRVAHTRIPHIQAVQGHKVRQGADVGECLRRWDWSAIGRPCAPTAAHCPRETNGIVPDVNMPQVWERLGALQGPQLVARQHKHFAGWARLDSAQGGWHNAKGATPSGPWAARAADGRRASRTEAEAAQINNGRAVEVSANPPEEELRRDPHAPSV